MSLTKVPLNAITADRIGTTANTTSGANVVFLGNTAPTSDLVSNQVGLLKGTFAEFVPFHYQGETQGYYGNMQNGSPAPTILNIYKVSFASDTPASDTGIDFLSFPQGAQGAAGVSSSTNGYMIGHTSGISGDTGHIARFPFALDANMSDVGELVANIAGTLGYGSAMSTTEGYVYGGSEPGGSGSYKISDRIQKFPFSTDTSASDSAELSSHRAFPGGGSTIQSLTSGYTVCGMNTSLAAQSTIDKFSLISDTNATDVGETTHTAEGDFTTASSQTNGYKLAGAPGFGTTTIDKIPFASDTSATDVGETTQGGTQLGGACGKVAGYIFGGRTSPGGYSDMIQKLTYSSDTSTSDIAELHAQVAWGWSHAAN